jgi:hypothetical protein
VSRRTQQRPRDENRNIPNAGPPTQPRARSKATRSPKHVRAYVAHQKGLLSCAEPGRTSRAWPPSAGLKTACRARDQTSHFRPQRSRTPVSTGQPSTVLRKSTVRATSSPRAASRCRVGVAVKGAVEKCTAQAPVGRIRPHAFARDVCERATAAGAVDNCCRWYELIRSARAVASRGSLSSGLCAASALGRKNLSFCFCYCNPTGKFRRSNAKRVDLWQIRATAVSGRSCALLFE